MLYVLNVFWWTKNLSTPLEVLHTFLNVFANFDWDRNAVSIHGPVPLSELSGSGNNVSASSVDKNKDSKEKAKERTSTGDTGEPSDPGENCELLTPEFMWRMLDKYGNENIMKQHAAAGGGSRGGISILSDRGNTSEGVCPMDTKNNNQEHKKDSSTKPIPVHMPIKHLNVIDPLLPSNNLGRSVSMGNASRIKKALKLAASKLSTLRQMSVRDGRDDGVNAKDGTVAGNTTTNPKKMCDHAAARVLQQFFGNTARHRRVQLLPSAPATPGGREHADEVSMTPMSVGRRHSVTVLALPGGRTAMGEHGGISPVPPRRLEQSLSEGDLMDAEKTGVLVVGANSHGVDVDSDSHSDSASGDEWPDVGPGSPTHEQSNVVSGCPVMHGVQITHMHQDIPHLTTNITEEERGPFWGRWDPLPEAELAAAAAAEALANRHFPRLSNASSVDGVGVDTINQDDISESQPGSSRNAAAAVAAAAFVAAADTAAAQLPHHARGLSFSGDTDFDQSIHRQLADGSTPGSSRAESRGASQRGGTLFAHTRMRSELSVDTQSIPGDGETDSLLGTSPTKSEGVAITKASSFSRQNSLSKRASDKLSIRVGQNGSGLPPQHPQHLQVRVQPPVPPGPPPSDVERAAREAAAARLRREMSCPTFFPETVGSLNASLSTSPSYAYGQLVGNPFGSTSFTAVSPDPPMPPPAVTPPESVGLGCPVHTAMNPKDIFAGDLDSIWRHLEFGRHYHRVAMIRRYEQMERIGQQRAAAAAAVQSVREGTFNGFHSGNGPRNGRGGNTRGGGAHSRTNSILSDVARGSNRRGSRRGGGGDGYSAAIAVALAAGAERPKRNGPNRRGGVGNAGGKNPNTSNQNKKSKDKSKTSGDKLECADGGDTKTKENPPLPPGPPPVGKQSDNGTERTGTGSPSGPTPSVPPTQTPSWGPKGSAQSVLDVIKRPPFGVSGEVKTVEAKTEDSAPGTTSNSSGKTAPSVFQNIVTPPVGLTAAVGVKGSWSSLVARDVPNASSPQNNSDKESVLGPNSSRRQSKVDASVSPPGSVSGNAAESTVAASEPGVPTTVSWVPTSSVAPKEVQRPLAGAWAKGPVVEALKKEPTKVDEKVSENNLRDPTLPDASAEPPSSPTELPAIDKNKDLSSPSSASSDSNPGEKENSLEKKKVRASDETEKSGDRETKTKKSEKKEISFVQKEDDFPGLGGKGPVVATSVASTGVWGGKQ